MIMLFKKSVSTLFCHLFFMVLLFSQNHINLKNTIDNMVYEELEIDFERSPSFIIGVIEKDSTFIFPFGSIKKDTSVLPSPENLFEIGNLTNVFTARLINILVDKNLLDKDVSINNYLPTRFQNTTATDITIQKLLTHTSGLPRVPLGIGLTQKKDNQPYISYTKAMLIKISKHRNFFIK